jgi:hypothetical protein
VRAEVHVDTSGIHRHPSGIHRHPAPVANGYPWVRGKCPSCGWRSLFVSPGGYLTCATLECRNPCAAAELLGAFVRRVPSSLATEAQLGDGDG